MNLWIHRRNSKLRPGVDDSLRTCGHSNAIYFFFRADDPVDRMRWLALCRSCFAQHRHEPDVECGESVRKWESSGQNQLGGRVKLKHRVRAHLFFSCGSPSSQTKDLSAHLVPSPIADEHPV